MTTGAAILCFFVGVLGFVLTRILERVLLRRRPPEDVGRWLDRVSSRAHALVDARLEVAWQEHELHRECEGQPQLYEDQVHLVVQLGQNITENARRRAIEKGFRPEDVEARASFAWPFREKVEASVPHPPRLPEVASPSVLPRRAEFVFGPDGSFRPG